MCFVCGEKNDFGLRAKFYETDNNELVALINPSEQHQGYPGRMHGGIAATILDETMARSMSRQLQCQQKWDCLNQ
jgi:acyl-coenzyme A thioesterase PaaI-like protein